MVLYQEKLYSVGKIPGGFIKREGRPTDAATLAARMIDRPMRPMFPEDFRNEVQVVNTVLSVDKNNSPELTALFGSSLSVSISKIPFNGPVAAVKVGRVNGEFVINPTIPANIIPLPNNTNTFVPHNAPISTNKYGITFINSYLYPFSKLTSYPDVIAINNRIYHCIVVIINSVHSIFYRIIFS